MDAYGYYELDDARFIADHINNGNNVVFSYSLQNESAFVISIFPCFTALNHLSYGQPFGRIFVGIMFKGYFHFDPNKIQFPDYIMEKLGLAESEAIPVCDLLNAIFPLLNK